MIRKTIVVTGGYGFIGSAVIRQLIREDKYNIINIDKLTYASNKKSINTKSLKNYKHHKIDLCNFSYLDRVIKKYSPDYVINLAAETHVDRSIDGPDFFINTNINGSYNLLKSCYKLWRNYDKKKKNNFRFIHVSTDEVYGSLKRGDNKFTEKSQYKPNSPYSASKAASDHLVLSWNKTYDFPSIVTNTCNNYGPWQFPEKLIPLVINKCLLLQKIPVYGNGLQVRDWIHVDDHVLGILKVLSKGRIGEKYNIGSNNELRNIDVINHICETLQVFAPSKIKYKSLITKVPDRPGHDFRYAIDNSKIKNLGWHPKYKWNDGLRLTIEWYLSNKFFLENTNKHSYSGERLGRL